MPINPPTSSAVSSIQIARAEIDHGLDTSVEGVVDVSNVRIAQCVEDRPKGEDCHAYVFKNPSDGYYEMLRTHREIDALREVRQPDDIVLYCDGAAVLHVGIVCDEQGNVLSKWGPDGHVYRHAPLMVPTEYGDVTRVFRPAARASVVV